MTSSSSSQARRRVIDFHAHVVVPEVYELAAEHNVFSELPTDPGVTDEMREGIRMRARLVLGRMSDISERIGRMDAMGVDVQVLSASLVHQGLEWADAQLSLRLARTTNDWIARAVATSSPRLVGLGTLPLHVPALAVAELERCMRELNLKGAAISTTAAGMEELGDPGLRAFWAKAEEMSAVVYIHPGGNRDRRFKRFHLWNSVGQAFEEAMAISSLMYDGVLEAFPKLRICVSHGGGYMPYYMGRIDRNYAEKANTRIHMRKPPTEYLRMLYFDSCVCDRAVLGHLVEKVGAERVVLGSDYPVGETKPVEFVTGTDFSDMQRERILGTNAAALLGIGPGVIMDERLVNPISTHELERRWRAVRKAMDERGIEALVMQNNNDWLGGYVRWFTDTPLSNGYLRSVIFPARERMTVVDMGARGASRRVDAGDEANRGVGEILFTPSFTSVAYTDDYQAVLVAADLKRHGYRTVGWIAAGAMPHRFVQHIERELEGVVRFVDATGLVDLIKAIKSEEEQDLIRKCAQMQDEVFRRVIAKIRPGMTGNDITALAQYEGRLLGSEQGLFLGSAAPLGQASRFVDRHLQGRRIAAGEHFALLIENNGPGGFYTEIARIIVLGKASNELIDGFEAMKEAQAHTLALLKPGASCAEIAQRHDDYMRARGLPPELRLYAHGQGYDLVERPLLRADETMTLAQNMNLAVHPGYETDSLFAVICDNYLVGADGPGACLHATPKQVFEL